MSNMPANVRISAQFPFPATTQGTTPIAVTKANGIWSVALPLGALATQNPSGGSLTTDYLLVWDSLSGTYFKMPVSNIPTGPPGPPGAAGPPGPSGGITDAPSDGVNYGRKNASWNNLDTIYAPIAAAAPLDALAYSGMQINGSMEVSQEFGSSGPSGIINTTKYIVDGWFLFTSGAQVLGGTQNVPVVAGLPGFGAALQAVVQTANAAPAAGDFCCFFQRIEAYRVLRLAWGTASAQPLSIGFWVYANRPGTYSGSVSNNAATRSYPFVFTVNVGSTWEYKTVTIPGDTTGTWSVSNNTFGMQFIITMMTGVAHQGVAGTWNAGNFLGATGTINGVAATSDTMLITGVVVLPGIEVPTAARSPFIMRSFDQELVTCQRYLWFSDKANPASSTSPMMGFYAILTDRGHVMGPQPAFPLRAAPSTTIWYNGAPATWINRNTAGTSTPPVFAANQSGLAAYQFVGGGVTATNIYSFDMKLDARL
jgi:hypothetical protein